MSTLTISEPLPTGPGKFEATADDGQVVDLEGKYLIPGLIDSHVHVSATPGEKEEHKMLRPEMVSTALRMPYVLRDMLSRGFTTSPHHQGFEFDSGRDETFSRRPALAYSSRNLSNDRDHRRVVIWGALIRSCFGTSDAGARDSLQSNLGRRRCRH